MSLSKKNHQYYTIYCVPTFGPSCICTVSTSVVNLTIKWKADCLMRERVRDKKRVIRGDLILGGTIFLQQFFSTNLWFFHSNLRSTIAILSPITMPKPWPVSALSQPLSLNWGLYLCASIIPFNREGKLERKFQENGKTYVKRRFVNKEYTRFWRKRNFL